MMIKRNLLIDLDVLLDTRIGTMRQHFSNKMPKFNIEEYVKRIRADFWTNYGISDAEWKQAWDKRDADTLFNSTYTEFYHQIPILLTGYLMQGKRSPELGALEVYVNVWPYDLTEVEREDIVYCVQERMVDECVIKTVSISPWTLTPEVLKRDYQAYVCYDMEKWFECQHEDLKVNKIPTVTMNYPAVINHYDEAEFHYMMEQKIDPFRDLRIRMAEFITLDEADAKLFSLHYPDLPQSHP